jgi:hypothetical protein
MCCRVLVVGAAVALLLLHAAPCAMAQTSGLSNATVPAIPDPPDAAARLVELRSYAAGVWVGAHWQPQHPHAHPAPPRPIPPPDLS